MLRLIKNRRNGQISTTIERKKGTEAHTNRRPKRIMTSKGGQFAALLIISIFVITAFIPIGTAKGEDFLTMDSALENAEITNVLKMDTMDVLKKAIDGESISVNVNKLDISFKLVEGNLLSDNFTITYTNGVVANRDDIMDLPRFFTGESEEPGRYITATIAGKWMRFTIDLEDGDAYSIEAYDGTGESGYFAVLKSDIQSVTGSDESSINPPVTISSTNNEIEMGVELPFQPTNETEMLDFSIQALDVSCISSFLDISEPSLGVTETTTYTNEHSYPLVRIYLVADYTYSWMHSSWSNDMCSRLWDVHSRFEAQAGVSFEIVGTESLASSVIPSTTISGAWDNFRTYLNGRTTYPTIADWDVAHLFNGKSITGGYFYSPESGAGQLKFTGNTAYNGYGCSVSYQSAVVYALPNKADWLIGHSIALSLNTDPAFATNTYDWMLGSYPTGGQLSQFTFSSQNIERIRSFSEQVCDKQKLINYGASSTWADNAGGASVGLYTTNMVVTSRYLAQVGDTVNVGYTIYNTGNIAIQYNEAYVAAVSPSGTVLSSTITNGLTIPAHGSQQVSGTLVLNELGEWQLFPRVHNVISGVHHYSPYAWLSVHPTAYVKIAETLGAFSSTTNANVELFYRWALFQSKPSSVTNGPTVTAYYSLYSMSAGQGTDTLNNIFVGCRNPSGTNKDFGYASSQSLIQKASGIMGSGYRLIESRTLDATGTWTFWPAYQGSNGGWGPYQWHALTVQVKSIKGYIKDNINGCGLNGAVVACSAYGGSVTTGTNGYYSLCVLSGTYTISVSQSAHVSTSRSVTASLSTTRLDISMVRQTGYLGPYVPGTATKIEQNVIDASIPLITYVNFGTPSINLLTGIVHGSVEVGVVHAMGAVMAHCMMGVSNYAFTSTGDQFTAYSKWALPLELGSWVYPEFLCTSTATATIVYYWKIIDHSDNNRVYQGSASSSVIIPGVTSQSPFYQFWTDMMEVSSTQLSIPSGHSLEYSCWTQFTATAMVVPDTPLPGIGCAGSGVNMMGPGYNGMLMDMGIRWT